MIKQSNTNFPRLFYECGFVFETRHRRIRFVDRPDVAEISQGGLEPADPQGEALGRLFAAAPEGHGLLTEIATVLRSGGDFQLGPKGRHARLLARLDRYFAKAEGRDA
jgi:hypothetical protein